MSRDPVESEPPYAYVRGNPINQVDPSGLFPSELIERSISPTTLNTLKAKRSGLYKLLRDAGDGDTVDALRIYIDPFGAVGPPYRSLRGGFLECRDNRLIVTNPQPAGSTASTLVTSLDQFINEIEMEMRSRPHPDESRTRWAKESDSHYYVRSVYLAGGEFHYYSDFAGQDSPLPDVVMREGSISIPHRRVEFGGVGGGKLVDKFGQGYSFSGVGAGLGVPGFTKIMDGYVNPPSLGNERATLQQVIEGYGYSFEADSIISGSGTSFPIPEAGRRIDWFTRGVAPLGGGVSIGFTKRRPDLDNHSWNHLDEPVADAVALLPDNGCCGQ